jgi:hypothetical protein
VRGNVRVHSRATSDGWRRRGAHIRSGPSNLGWRERWQAERVSHSCACNGSPCLRHCLHGASIGASAGVSAGRRSERRRSGMNMISERAYHIIYMGRTEDRLSTCRAGGKSHQSVVSDQLARQVPTDGHVSHPNQFKSPKNGGPRC